MSPLLRLILNAFVVLAGVVLLAWLFITHW